MDKEDDDSKTVLEFDPNVLLPAHANSALELLNNRTFLYFNTSDYM